MNDDTATPTTRALDLLNAFHDRGGGGSDDALVRALTAAVQDGPLQAIDVLMVLLSRLDVIYRLYAVDRGVSWEVVKNELERASAVAALIGPILNEAGVTFPIEGQ